jgi:predicted nucleotidyltransferase
MLFGSAIENELNYRSDIDIAVIFSEITKEEAEEFRIKTMGRLSSKIDIQVYNTLPDKIKKQIDKNARTLYKK